MSLEIFRDVVGFEGYQVTSWGRVLSKRTGKFMYQQVHHKGYLRVDLFKHGKRIHCKVHRLVAEAFIDNPDGKPQVNHIDGNNQNNSVANLEWVTNLENAQKAKKLRQMQRA